MLYAEKAMISRQDQYSPMHRHNIKAEDIINRGGATLALKLYNSDAEGQIDLSTDVTFATDGVRRTQGPGEVLRLAMLMTHYREPIDFSVRRLEEAENILRKWLRVADQAGWHVNDDVLNQAISRAAD